MKAVDGPQAAFSRSALGTGHMDDAGGDDEAHRLQVGIVDGLLHTGGELGAMELTGILFAVGRSHMAHHGHQLALYVLQQVGAVDHSEQGTEHVQLSVGFDARVVLRHAEAPTEAGQSFIAGLSIYLLH